MSLEALDEELPMYEVLRPTLLLTTPTNTSTTQHQHFGHLMDQRVDVLGHILESMSIVDTLFPFT